MFPSATGGVSERDRPVEEVESVRLRFFIGVSLRSASTCGTGEGWPEEDDVELESEDKGSAIRGSTQPSGDSGNVPSQSCRGSTQLGDEA